VFQLNEEENTMPAFTFEKISAPKNQAANKPVAIVQRRSVIGSLLDRMTQARLQKSQQNIVKFEISSDRDRK
jgi:hypothetical protein